MKTLGGVGAVVMGAMLLLTVKVGPASSQPVPSSSAKNDPLAAVAAVPEAPPRSTPAAAPVPVPVSGATAARRVVVIVPAAEAGTDEGTRPKPRHRVELPQAFDCSFELELPVGFSAL
jgi:hypothetical protein